MTTISSDQMLVPAMLYGHSRSDARKRFKPVMRRAVKSLSWRHALKDVEMIPLADLKGDFTSTNSSYSMLFTGDILWMDFIMEDYFGYCQDVCVNGVKMGWQQVERDLLLSGLDDFWFALVMCVGGLWLPMNRPKDEAYPTAIQALGKLLRWWPMICPYDRRFTKGSKYEMDMKGWRGWPGWGCGLPMNMCRDLGISESNVESLEDITPIVAGELAMEWLKAASNG